MPTEKSEKPTPKEAAELFAQRIANIASPLIADLPAVKRWPDVTKLLWELRCRVAAKVRLGTSDRLAAEDALDLCRRDLIRWRNDNA